MKYNLTIIFFWLKNKLKLQVYFKLGTRMRFKIVLYNIIKREKLLINYYFVERMIQIIFFRTLLCNCLVSLEIGFLCIVIRQKLSEIHAFHSIHIYTVLYC